MEKEKEIVKIMTFTGRVITLTISNQSDSRLFGTDKFGDSIIIPISEIKSMLPIRKESGK